MMQVILFIVLISLALVNGFSTQDALSESIVKSTVLDPYERKKKCAYINPLFDAGKNACPVPPMKLYQDIYEPSYETELWEFQQEQCGKSILAKIGVFIFIVTMLLFLSTHATF
jgi:hypothetical protein